jgi:hypothetical protein
MPVLIHGPPEVVASAVDAEIDLVQMPLVAAAGRAAAEFIGEVLAELQAPLAHRLVGQEDAASGQHFLHVAVAQREAKIQPYRMADDLGRIAVAGIGILGVVHGREAYRLGRPHSS